MWVTWRCPLDRSVVDGERIEQLQGHREVERARCKSLTDSDFRARPEVRDKLIQSLELAERTPRSPSPVNLCNWVIYSMIERWRSTRAKPSAYSDPWIGDADKSGGSSVLAQ